jgi:hypothetical protein
MGARINAFMSCLEFYSPIGFHASYDFLKLSAGPFDSDPDALLGALAQLTASRDLWLAAHAAYAQKRRAEKRHGRRTAARSDPPPVPYRLWLGAERTAALFGLEHDYREFGASHPSLGQLAERTLDRRGILDPADRALVEQLWTDADRRRAGLDWSKPAWPGWHRLSEVLRLLAHIRNAADARG